MQYSVKAMAENRGLYQNGPDQNDPQIFDMSKTAQRRYKTAQSHDRNGPQLN